MGRTNPEAGPAPRGAVLLGELGRRNAPVARQGLLIRLPRRRGLLRLLLFPAERRRRRQSARVPGRLKPQQPHGGVHRRRPCGPSSQHRRVRRFSSCARRRRARGEERPADLPNQPSSGDPANHLSISHFLLFLSLSLSWGLTTDGQDGPDELILIGKDGLCIFSRDWRWPPGHTWKFNERRSGGPGKFRSRHLPHFGCDVPGEDLIKRTISRPAAA